VLFAALAAFPPACLCAIAAQEDSEVKKAPGEEAGRSKSAGKKAKTKESAPKGDKAGQGDATGSADVAKAGPGDGDEPVNAAEAGPPLNVRSGPDPGPPQPSPEHSADLFLPSIAQDQSGFIPDVAPQDLITQPPPLAAPERYLSPLGTGLLPTQSAEQLIARFDQNPGLDLDANFARIVVPRGNIRGSTETKQFQIDGGLKVFYDDVTITGDRADIDEKGETAIIRGNVSIVDPQYTLKTDELRVYFGDKRTESIVLLDEPIVQFIVLGFVTLVVYFGLILLLGISSEDRAIAERLLKKMRRRRKATHKAKGTENS
jgi:hypothetical protein